MSRLVYLDAAKHLTLEDAILCYENGIALEVHDGKNLVLIIEWR